jgi:hypothetical protein
MNDHGDMTGFIIEAGAPRALPAGRGIHRRL